METEATSSPSSSPAVQVPSSAVAHASTPTLAALPAIPAKRYFTIGEVSELCGVKPHVLRYWEQEFTQLKPLKRRGNRRYYQHHEVLLIRRIRELLYEHGFTINGARNRLEEPSGSVIGVPQSPSLRAASPSIVAIGQRGQAHVVNHAEALQTHQIRVALKEILALLQA